MAAGKTADKTVGKKTNDPDETVGKDDPATSAHTGEMPKVDFSTFVLSLGTTALYQLGVMSDPASGDVAEPDPLIAQQTIDTLEMLCEKTRGNLDEEERKLIESLLYELRMRFVELGR
jgi:hypothetical protein